MPQFDISRVSTFVDGLDHPEGLAFAADGFLWAGGERGQVYRVSPDGTQVQVLAETGGFSLGMAFDRQGNCYVCDHKLPAVVKVTPDGQWSVFADEVAGRKIRVPNVPVFDSEGRLYVSDSGDWHGNNGVIYRFTPDGRGEVFDSGPFNFTNGLAIDARGDFLYVVESCNDDVLRIRIKRDGAAGEREVFARDVWHVPDGLAFDARGTLYITCYASNRLYTADQSGALSVLVEDPDYTPLAHPTNCAFGGPNFDELYISNLGRWHISRLALGVKGQPLYGGLR
jgi:gluconolactonase